MKKLTFLAVIALASCNVSTPVEVPSTDTTAVSSDTIAVDTVVNTDSITVDSIEK